MALKKVVPHDGADAGGVLSLKNMDPDFDGDGKISPLEKAVYVHAQMDIWEIHLYQPLRTRF